MTFLWAVFTGAAHAGPCAGFLDVDDSSDFCTSITWMKNQAITLGCGDGTNYCPADLVRRDHMAAFLYRMRNVAFMQGGNAFGATAILGTTDNQALDIRANGARVMRYEPNGTSPNVVGGHDANLSSASDFGQVIGGGGNAGVNCFDPPTAGTRACRNATANDYAAVLAGSANQANGLAAVTAGGVSNTAGGEASSVGGGRMNTAAGFSSTVGGGFVNSAAGPQSTVAGGSGNEATGNDASIGGGVNNTASTSASTVAGGAGNTASGLNSTVGGGSNNVASGGSATVPGGSDNAANGNFSFAAGVRAKAVHHRSFVWSGTDTADIGSQADGDFVVYAPSRVRLYAAAMGTGGCTIGGADFGGNLNCDGVITAASFVPPSDRALKSDVVPVDPAEVLARVVAMPVAEWSYTSTPGVRHMGPMGQDFHAAFRLGATDKGIATVDADGVALAAIQGLNARVEAQAREIAALKRVVERLLAAR